MSGKQKAETVSAVLCIEGMTCAGCAGRIEKRLRKLPGVAEVSASYSGGTAKVSYNPLRVDEAAMAKALEGIGYRVAQGKTRDGFLKSIGQFAGLIALLAGLFFALRQTGLLDVFNMFPQARADMGYGMLFLIGVLTSVHCVAMCGGISLSQCLPNKEGEKASPWRASVLYNLGRVISYTLIGGVVGALGSVISFTGAMRGVVQLAAGIFMVIMGLNMLGLFPALRRLVPAMPKVFGRLGGGERERKGGPLIVGLLNGLMPCGPLQSMQLYALSTGSFFFGALSMLLFSLGTVPLMLGFGALSSSLSRKFTGRMMTAGAALVVILGISMLQSGLALSSFTPQQAQAAAIPEATVQEIVSDLSPRGYPAITVEAGRPVRWTIRAANGTVNGCNYAMIIPAWGIQQVLAVGDNVIEFTPTETGVFPYSCWMGMIRSSVEVVEGAGGV